MWQVVGVETRPQRRCQMLERWQGAWRDQREPPASFVSAGAVTGGGGIGVAGGEMTPTDAGEAVGRSGGRGERKISPQHRKQCWGGNRT